MVSFEEEIRDALEKQLLYESATYENCNHAMDIIKQTWQRYFECGFVNVGAADMPSFAVGVSGNALEFKWINAQYGAYI
jgi:hypothetical protein